ncbi:hypothetical protein ACLOJK_030400 [Asimina triloba]
MTRFNQEARKVPCLLIEVYMSALIQGIQNHELTRELSLRPPRSICKLNEVIVRHISIENIKKWRVDEDRLLINHLDHKKASRVPTSTSTQSELTILMPPAHRRPLGTQPSGDPWRPSYKGTLGDLAIKRPLRTQPSGDPWGLDHQATPGVPAVPPLLETLLAPVSRQHRSGYPRIVLEPHTNR